MTQSSAVSDKVRTLDEVLRWLDGLQRAAQPRSTGAWPLGSVLHHLAQSVEMSMDGFPELKPAWFRSSVGPMAFAVFSWRGAMSHGLADPIPGAPALPAGPDWQAGAQRLRLAVQRFQAHRGALQPHFAYGALDHADFALAHALHVANHQDEIRGS